MPSLPELLTDERRKQTVIDECVQLVDDEVRDKTGISGLAIKAGYAAVKGIKPGFIRNVVRDLLPEFAAALDPIYQEAVGRAEPIAGYFERNAGRVADALLAITDEKARRTTNGLIRGTYDKLRGTAKRNVEQAVPRLGRLVERHAG
ncbi:MAG: hypothetical protein NZ898_02630 [Myxococcota bacterium]|nr:hypothetical protein [Myxococcota bacterium]MDW8361268.1 hypothetical protein [Myxococcales bacterium]